LENEYIKRRNIESDEFVYRDPFSSRPDNLAYADTEYEKLLMKDSRSKFNELNKNYFENVDPHEFN
jgi:hypothetical protein